jgi:hypothetical protein
MNKPGRPGKNAIPGEFAQAIRDYHHQRAAGEALIWVVAWGVMIIGIVWGLAWLVIG